MAEVLRDLEGDVSGWAISFEDAQRIGQEQRRATIKFLREQAEQRRFLRNMRTRGDESSS